MTGSGPAVSVADLTFNYGAMSVLDQISLDVPTGEIFGILGANGAGKTTLIRLLVGLLKPASGSVLVLGQTPSANRSGGVGYMPQLNALYEELSVEENVGFFARMYGISNKSARQEVYRIGTPIGGPPRPAQRCHPPTQRRDAPTSEPCHLTGTRASAAAAR